MPDPVTPVELPVWAARLFYAGVSAMALFGLGHFCGFLAAYHAARHDPSMADLTRAMREKKSDVGGFQPSILDFREYFSASFSLLLWLAAALNLIGFRFAHDPVAAMRALCAVDIIAMILLLAASFVFSIFQGIVSCTCIAMLFVGALFALRSVG